MASSDTEHDIISEQNGAFCSLLDLMSILPDIIHDDGRTNTMDFLYDSFGKRKYVTVAERRAFLAAASSHIDPAVYTFCATLAYTGARISEVLALVPERVDPDAGIIVLECLKKRRQGVFRAVPIPPWLIDRLDSVHVLGSRRLNQETKSCRLWPWCRTTAWKRVKYVMADAGISGPHASPKGLRHGFGVGAIQAGLSLNMVRKWLGHSNLSTTSIYADVVGIEEQEMANKIWNNF